MMDSACKFHRKRVLINAFAFSPNRGSEGAVGWKIATGLAKKYDVTVLTGDLNASEPWRAELLEYAAQKEYPHGITVQHIRPTPLIKMFERLHQSPGQWWLYYTAYRLWQLEAFRVATQLHSENPFSICHQLTFIGYREPGYLWKLGIPFFWGPIAGADTMPMAYYQMFSPSEIFRPLSRDLLNHLQMLVTIRARKAARAATKIWVVSHAEKMLIERWGLTSETLLETGAQPPKPELHEPVITGKPLHIVWSGSMHARKALPLLLHALVKLDTNQPWCLEILGDGVHRTRWERLALQLGLAHQVIWHGNLPREKALEVMQACQVLVHTGVREGTPHVVLEALSLGLPIICHDACGMGAAVTEECGIKIPMVSPQTSTEKLAAALKTYLTSPELLARHARGALHRARELSWEGIVNRISQGYEEVGSC